METFASFKIIKKLGQGGFCEVFQIEHQQQTYALKKLKTAFQYDQELIRLLEGEAELLKSLCPSPFFPQFYNFDHCDSTYYIWMEYLEGQNLEEQIKKEKKLSYETALPIFTQIAQALKQIHSLNLYQDRPTLHGDIRPSNIFLSSKGLKLLDPGLREGSFDYMPLERLQENTLSFYTDIFAWGLCFYEALEGKHLFKGTTRFEVYCSMREAQINASLFSQDIPMPLQKIIFRSLDQEEGQHYLSAEELLEDLAKL